VRRWVVKSGNEGQIRLYPNSIMRFSTGLTIFAICWVFLCVELNEVLLRRERYAWMADWVMGTGLVGSWAMLIVALALGLVWGL
jgi:hypothetical protein